MHQNADSPIGSCEGSRAGDTSSSIIETKKDRMKQSVLTSDKGLCGAFNTNILKAADKYIKTLKNENIAVSLSVVGRKSRDFFRRRNIPMRNTWIGLSGRISYANAQEIANNLTENYSNESFDEVVVIYNEFKSLISENHQDETSSGRYLKQGGRGKEGTIHHG